MSIKLATAPASSVVCRKAFWRAVAIARRKDSIRRAAVPHCPRLPVRNFVNDHPSTERYNQAVAALQAGDPGAAICHLQPVVVDAPGFLEGRNVLGVAFKRCQRFGDAIEQFEYILRIDPLHSSARNNLAATYIAHGDFTRAEPLLNEIIASGGATAESFSNLAAIFEKQSRVESAIAAARRGLSLDRDNQHCLLILARCLRRNGKLEDAYDVIQQAGRASNDAQLASNMRFEQARILDRLNRPALAFAGFEAANRLSAKAFQVCGVDGAKYLQELDELLAVLEFVNVDGASMATVTQVPTSRPDPVFLVGFPRSGTTLLGNILDAHPRCQTFEETTAVESVIEQVRQLPDGYPASLLTMDGDDRQHLRQCYFSVLDSMSQDPSAAETVTNQVWIDQHPFNTANVWPILTVFPQAKFLFALRHPCDVCLSCLMQEFEPNCVTANLRSLEEASLAYVRTMTVWCESISRLSPQVLTVRYEDLVRGFDRTMSDVLEFIGVEWHESIQDFAGHARRRSGLRTASYHQITEPLYQRGCHRWKRYQDHMGQTPLQLQPFIDKFGYAN